METLKYKIIKSKTQYREYCNILEALHHGPKKKAELEAIELLIFLIEKWDAEHNTFADADPVQLLQSLMAGHNLSAAALARMLDVSKGLVSDILNYKKGLSKEVIRTLATYFKVSQEAFNRPYQLVSPFNSHLKDAAVMNKYKTIKPKKGGKVLAGAL